MLKLFTGGIHPEDNKHLTSNKAVESMPLFPRYWVPLKQHIGEPCVPLVKIGDSVKKGQCIAQGDIVRSVPIHAPISGTIFDISPYRDPVSGHSTSIVIDSDGKDEWLTGLLTNRDYRNIDKAVLLQHIRSSGIVGMGGAAFPSHTKLSPPSSKKIDTLIVNGSECEPYLTSDYRIMMEHPEDIVKGCLIVMKILDVNNCFIGIEENKKPALSLLKKFSTNTSITVFSLPTKYPQGGEKMLIWALTGREVQSGKLPMDAGCVVFNVSTLKAIADAVERNIPLIERIVTISGSAIAQCKNIRARIGTRFCDAINFCGGYSHPAYSILMGGPMMGIAQADTLAPIVKACSGILGFHKKDAMDTIERQCIRCGKCIDVCVMRLRPNMLSILSEQRKYQTALLEFDLLDCIECGSCAYVCPAKRNIVQYIRLAKAKNALLKNSVRK